MKKIIVAVDLSDAARAVCAAGCKLAREMKATVVLVHVVHPVPLVVGDMYGMDTTYLEEMTHAMDGAGRQQLATLARVCAKRGVAVRTVLRLGPPAAVLLQQTRGARCIVLGSHGHGAMYDLLVGSTAQGVLRKASCPVLVVPAPRPVRR